ncbi:MAG: SOS response-associated peptidase [Suilimivivens sp.]
MCGRYHIDREMVMEVEELGKSMSIPFKMSVQDFDCGDIRPNDIALVLVSDGKGIFCQRQRFGFPKQDGQLVFNARSETALEKATFRDSILHRRAVIPATWFYEWNKSREQNIFSGKGQKVLYMAGCFNRCRGGLRFVILTTEANASMKPVHDRMPLILEKDEVVAWLLDGSKTEEFLHKRPCLLERQTDYEQMNLFS